MCAGCFGLVVSESRSNAPSQIIIIIIIINVLIKVTLNEIRCRGTLQSQWSTLTDSTSLKAEESVNVTDESRSSWYSSWNGTGGSSNVPSQTPRHLSPPQSKAP